jgi:uncharacterized protein (DUF3820 family)
MTNEQFSELVAILRDFTSTQADIYRALVESSQPVIASQTRPSVAAGAVLIPMPSEIVQDAASVEIHFGKNKGRTLGSLSAKSLEWYAAEKPPQLKNDGTPFALRPDDLRLLNAARTLHHRLAPAAPAATLVLSQAPALDEEVPF